MKSSSLRLSLLIGRQQIGTLVGLSRNRNVVRGLPSSSRKTISNIGMTCDQDKRRNTEADRLQQQALLEEAKALTRSLYRLCLRSVRVIRHGNENDEKEFSDRERKRLELPSTTKGDVRLSMLSMLPPVDREDELRSRAEYYTQYARELFVQESDCLSFATEWTEQHIARYLHHLRQGDEHRRWLLADMKFDDPFFESFDQRRVDKFEGDALRFVNRFHHDTGPESSDNEDDPFDGDSDDDDETPGLPHWYKNPRSQ